MSESFNWGTYDPRAIPDADYEPIPEGDYKLIIKTAAEKPSKNGQSLGLSLGFEVLDGQHKKRMVFSWLTLSSKSSEAAQSIGQRQLAELCRACGIERPKGAHVFVGRMLRATVGIRVRDGKSDNTIARFLAKPDAQAQAQAQPEIKRTIVHAPAVPTPNQTTDTVPAPGCDDEPPF